MADDAPVPVTEERDAAPAPEDAAGEPGTGAAPVASEADPAVGTGAGAGEEPHAGADP
ncbi:hypothetical protein FM110_07325 [Brachybacterium nesterenkovii]|uniref:Uncharacterized protein n=1 Tax=Brachybacterium nesterenkovii TaxID=47847 RepID=A0A1X6X0D2_9MICO|nr:hypothetical protein FM110_07325 [Brachybacterium nesterenkovii]